MTEEQLGVDVEARTRSVGDRAAGQVGAAADESEVQAREDARTEYTVYHPNGGAGIRIRGKARYEAFKSRGYTDSAPKSKK